MRRIKSRPLPAAAANIAGLTSQLSKAVHAQREEGGMYAFINVLGERLVGIEVPFAPFDDDDLEMLTWPDLVDKLKAHLHVLQGSFKASMPNGDTARRFLGKAPALAAKLSGLLKAINDLEDKTLLSVFVLVWAFLTEMFDEFFPADAQPA